MRAEIREIPEAARRLTEPAAQQALGDAAAGAASFAPRMVATVARGSSDHAATVLSYAIQIRAGLPVASVPPSVASIYGARLGAEGVLALGLSQSGASEDLVRAMEMLVGAGARPMVLTNTPASPLGALGRPAVDVRAGPERAVAATKSFVNSVLAGLWILARWTGDEALAEGLRRVPEALDRAIEAPADDLVHAIADARGLTMTARGPALGLAQEGALKVQEVLGLGAAAYSGAEVLHGPVARMGEGHRVIVFGDARGRGMAQAADALRARGADLFEIPPDGPAEGGADGDADAFGPLLRALPQIVRLYAALEALAVRRGLDPDRPKALRKETVTL